MLPPHNGEASGLAGRVLVFLAGHVPLVLYVTGVRIRLHHRKPVRVKRRRASAPPAAPARAPE